MAICVFFGHSRSLDAELAKNLTKAAMKIVQDNQSVRFVLWGRTTSPGTNNFLTLCQAAAYHAKCTAPEKDIRLSGIAYKQDFEEICGGGCTLPSYMVDDTITPPPSLWNNSAGKGRMERWLIDQADYVIAYLYSCVFESERQYVEYAKKKGKTIVDVTDRTALEKITASFSGLPERTRYVMEQKLRGEANKNIGAELGVSANRIDAIFHEGSWSAMEKFFQPMGKSACTLLCFPPPSYLTLTALSYAMQFITTKINLQKIVVPGTYWESAYRFAVERKGSVHSLETVVDDNIPPDLDKVLKLAEAQGPWVQTDYWISFLPEGYSSGKELACAADRAGAQLLNLGKTMKILSRNDTIC